MRKTLLSLLSVFFVTLLSSMVFSADTGKVKISVLSDDTVLSDKFVTEHGFSVLIELPNGHRWLADTGTTDVFLENAKRLNVNLDNLTGITISHGHDDHTGGLSYYTRLKGKPPIYGHPYIWNKSYQVEKDKPLRITNMPYQARQNAAPNFRALNNFNKLDENFYFFTDVPREKGSFAPTKGNFLNEDSTGPVPIMDDATVVVKTPRGLVVVFGCGHAGYINILKAVRKEFPKEKLLAVIGGLHLKNASDKVIEESINFTNSFKADDFVFYGGHCTGNNTIKAFKKKFGDKVVQPLGAGRQMEF